MIKSHQSSLLGSHGLLESGFTRLHSTELRLGKIQLQPKGFVVARSKRLQASARIETPITVYRYDHGRSSVTVEPHSTSPLLKRLPKLRPQTVTFVFSDGSWWAKIDGETPTPYPTDIYDSLGVNLSWSEACLDPILQRTTGYCTEYYSTTPYHELGPIRMMRNGMVCIDGQQSFTQWDEIPNVDCGNFRIVRSGRSPFAFLTERAPIMECVDLLTGKSFYFAYFDDEFWYQLIPARHLGWFGHAFAVLACVVRVIVNLVLIGILVTIVIAILWYFSASLKG